ncbi:hypothetical protein [Salinithrix halophila]|uniref:Uncharacterized protein n=1 Tax=Salinithrix halophila TaxID=1485204 RepID=A0ABV8JDL9_9BACL
MGNEKDVARTLFRLIVSQLEATKQENRLFSRIELVGDCLEVALAGGKEYRIEVKPVQSPGDQADGERSGESVYSSNKPLEEQDVVIVPAEEWEELLRTCELVVQFMEYDKEKMKDLAALVPDFPWEKRSEMMEGLLRNLRQSLAKTMSTEASNQVPQR